MVVKAAKAADGVYGVGGVLYHVRRISQTVIFKIFKRGLSRYVPEAPEHLAFADECGGSHVIKCDLFGVMVVDKKQYVTEPCLLAMLAAGRADIFFSDIWISIRKSSESSLRTISS